MVQPTPLPPAHRRGLPGPVIAVLAFGVVLLLGVLVGAVLLWSPWSEGRADVPPSSPPSAVPCWDGTTSTGRCPELTGPQALRYVFRLREDGLRCDSISNRVPAPVVTRWECRVDGDADTSIWLTQWKNVEVAKAQIATEYSAEPTSKDGILEYRDDNTDNGSQAGLVYLYQDHPFSVGVVTKTVSARDNALQRVTVAPAADLAAEDIPVTRTGDTACWDGSVADDPSTCPALTGTKAVSWVFSLDTEKDVTRCTEEDLNGKPAMVCSLTGHPDAFVAYREYPDVAAAKAAMQALGELDENPGDPLGYRSAGAVRPDHCAAWAYRGHPFTLTVCAPTSAQAAELEPKLWARPEADFRAGTPQITS